MSLPEPPTRAADVGIIGAGQLARMMVQAAIPLGLRVRLLATALDDGAAQVCSDVVLGQPDDPDAVRRLAAGARVLTYDHELVDTSMLAALEAEGQRLHPSPAAMAVGQDKALQHAELAAMGAPVPAYALVDDLADVERFAGRWGWPVVLKAVRGGYDGRGVWVAADPGSAAQVSRSSGAAGVRLLVEEMVPIDCEIAVLVARRANGEAVVYPVVETVQRGGICHELLVPAGLAPATAAEAARLGRLIAESLDVVGILAVEMFVSGGHLVVNELALRPHNSGHWSIEGAVTSQFENHLRAVLDLPLGDPTMTAPAVATCNVLAPSAATDLRAGLADALAVDGAHVHLYGKSPRPGRKVGHVTVTGADPLDVRERAVRAVACLAGAREQAL